jgi:hypothetical protein
MTSDASSFLSRTGIWFAEDKYRISYVKVSVRPFLQGSGAEVRSFMTIWASAPDDER